MGYLDDDNNSRFDRINRNLGGSPSEDQDKAPEREEMEEYDFMKYEAERTSCLMHGLEYALDGLKASGSEEAFNIARHLYSTVSTKENGDLVNKYL
ncbi:MAG: hypothetical protein ACI3ZQ_08280 [Candidatus Cryptobacteroides sp.]